MDYCDSTKHNIILAIIVSQCPIRELPSKLYN